MADGPEDKSIVWSDDFLIGIEELDFEHKSLIDDINELHRKLLMHNDIEEIGETLTRILSRMQAHFALEEHVMLSNKYRYYREHKAEHERLLDDYTESMAKLGKDASQSEREKIENVLRHWIVDHILASDKKMSLMIKGG